MRAVRSLALLPFQVIELEKKSAAVIEERRRFSNERNLMLQQINRLKGACARSCAQCDDSSCCHVDLAFSGAANFLSVSLVNACVSRACRRFLHILVRTWVPFDLLHQKSSLMYMSRQVKARLTIVCVSCHVCVAAHYVALEKSYNELKKNKLEFVAAIGVRSRARIVSFRRVCCPSSAPLRTRPRVWRYMFCGGRGVILE